MSLNTIDRAKVTSTTTGTGSFSLGSAVTGYQDFTGVGDGNQTYYTIENDTEWETGIGSYNSGTLSRDLVLESSNSGNIVDFSSGTKNVFIPQPAINTQGENLILGNDSIDSGLVAWKKLQKKFLTTCLWR